MAKVPSLSVAAFAADSRHYSASDRESLRHAWLERVSLPELAAAEGPIIHRTAVEVRLLDAFYDRTYMLSHTGVLRIPRR